MHSIFTFLISIIKLTGKKTDSKQLDFYETLPPVSPLWYYKLTTKEVWGWKQCIRNQTIVRKLNMMEKGDFLLFLDVAVHMIRKTPPPPSKTTQSSAKLLKTSWTHPLFVDVINEWSLIITQHLSYISYLKHSGMPEL